MSGDVEITVADTSKIGSSLPSPSASPSQVFDLTVADLGEALRQKGKPIYGLKRKLQARLAICLGEPDPFTLSHRETRLHAAKSHS